MNELWSVYVNYTKERKRTEKWTSDRESSDLNRRIDIWRILCTYQIISKAWDNSKKEEIRKKKSFRSMWYALDLAKLPIRYRHVDNFQILYTNHCIFQYISQLLSNYIHHYLNKCNRQNLSTRHFVWNFNYHILFDSLWCSRWTNIDRP